MAQTVKHAIGSALDAVGLYTPVAFWLRRRRTPTVVADYLRASRTKKLHLGCGTHPLPGWLNADVEPTSRSVIYLDATRRFPLPDDTFDYVFSEHMIEHIPYEDGLHMLGECRRVMVPGGKIRVATPTLAFLINLYDSSKSDLQKRYIEWSAETFLPGLAAPEDTFVINNFVRDWGHRFIYDEKVLRGALLTSGFERVAACNLNESDHLELRGLENTEKMPDGFLALETMVFEAQKPWSPI